jgi:1-acyl-sn-glycerol-3-phosphate acyltransferase
MPDEQEPIQVEMPSARPSDRMRLWWHFWRIFTRCLYTVTFHGRVLGRKNIPREGGVLLVSNHQSFLDPFLASLAFDRECNYMARDSLFVVPGLKQLIRSLNAFPVRRGTADLRAIKEALRRLKMGQMVLVFPEGTRTSDGRIGDLQPGVAAVAKQARVAVVPMLIEGAFDVWPRHALFPLPAKVVIRYAPAITREEVAALSKGQLLERIDRTLRQMQAEVRRIYHWPPVRERQGDRSLQHPLS